MIREIFLPQELQGYYIFPKRIIGFTVSKTYICATQIYFTGNTTSIEKYIEKQLEPGSSTDYKERAIKAIQSILESLDSYDAIYSSLSSSLCIFKELKLPFLSHEKIGMVINFEVEPLLPFSVNDAVIDFIITKKNLEDKSSEVLNG